MKGYELLKSFISQPIYKCAQLHIYKYTDIPRPLDCTRFLVICEKILLFVASILG